MKISQGPMAVVLTAVLALVATDALAQRGGGPGGGGRGPGGGGGFGGGGNQGGLASLLRVEQVREEIELMPDQTEALKKLVDDRPERVRPPEGIDFRTEEGRAELQKWREKLVKEAEAAEEEVRLKLEEVLLPNQMERLDQISVQVRGVSALMTVRVIKELKISDGQQKKMKEASEKAQQEMMTKMREIFSSGDRDGMREKMEEARKEVESKVTDVLTSDQKKAFEKLKGEAFEMPRRERGGRGGRGGADGGGRGGRGGAGGGGRGGRGGAGGGRPE